MPNLIKIYTKPHCPNCAKAKAAMDDAGLEYKTYIIGSNIEREEVQALFPAARNLPVITLDGMVVSLEEIL